MPANLPTLYPNDSFAEELAELARVNSPSMCSYVSKRLREIAPVIEAMEAVMVSMPSRTPKACVGAVEEFTAALKALHEERKNLL